MSNCKDKIKYTCGKVTNARCVDYEGDLAKCTKLDEDCRIHTVHEVLEDVAEILTDVCEDLDMANVEMECLELEAVEPSLPEVLTAVISKLCETKEGDCNLIFNTPIECANFDYGCLVDECGTEIAPSNLKELLQTMINHSCECCDGGSGPVNKAYFYEEVVDTKNISQNTPLVEDTEYSFITGYEGLTYKNNKATPMTVEVHISYNYRRDPPVEYSITSQFYEDLQAAITKTPLVGIDQIMYKKSGTNLVASHLYDVVSSSVISGRTIETVKTTPSSNSVISVIKKEIANNVSFFKVMTLLPGENVSLKFGVKDADTEIVSAQILVKEL